MLFLKNLLFTLIVPGMGGVYVPLLLAQGLLPASGMMFLIALALFLMGGAIYAWCVWNFASFGRGTPAPLDPPKKLVVRGLYRYTRNPIYLGALTVLLGWNIMFGGPGLLVYTLCVAIGFHLFVVLYEEPHLAQQFGVEYNLYCEKVGRWLPRFRSRLNA